VQTTEVGGAERGFDNGKNLDNWMIGKHAGRKVKDPRRKRRGF